MGKNLPIGAILAILVASAAYADCSVLSDPKAVVRPMNPALQTDANLIVSMSMLPKLMHIDYASAANKATCDLGQLASGNSSYELWGDDTAGGRRKGLPAKKGDPIALVVPVTDLLKAIEASKEGKAAAIEGYLLATVSQTDFTGWLFYTAMPDTMTLKRDMTAVLNGEGSPIFRNGADGKTSLFVPKS